VVCEWISIGRTLFHVFVQIAVVLVSVGVALATLSRRAPLRNRRSPASTTFDKEASWLYVVGVLFLLVSIFLSGALGALQETIFTKYGPHWEESVFYSVRACLVPQIPAF
jgi:UDP-xylose/UDP-N-acetylglucosamine transporter B4